MARILIAVPPLTGHLNPAASVAAELQQRGHKVIWASHVDWRGDLLPADAELHLLPSHAVLESGPLATAVRGLESVRCFFDGFCIPLARAGLPALQQIAAATQPDLMICDQQMMSGALVARTLGIPWLTFATTNVSMLVMWDMLEAWMEQQWATLQRECGLLPIEPRPDFSPYGVVVFSSPQLPGDKYPYYPARYHFVGPAFANRRAALSFPWEQLRPEAAKLLISLGTVSRDRGRRFYDVMMEACADLKLEGTPQRELQVIMVAPPELADGAPPNFIVQPRVPQIELLPHLDAVLCHGGHNTVCEALSFGLPLIVAPIRDDQPVIAQQIVDAGAGLFMRFGKVTAATARASVQELFREDSYRTQARRLQESLLGLGGACAAADIVDGLLQGGVQESPHLPHQGTVVSTSKESNRAMG